MNEMIGIFAIIGVSTVGAMVVVGYVHLLSKINDYMDKRKRKYAYEHRFDGTPTAACWCKDCIHYIPFEGVTKVIGRCDLFGHNRCYSDDHFCKEATPHE